ncbi:MAG: DNA-directed RNA polymerase subunit E'' [Candidatus Micrarchaeota archaeon]|nr:DNA-directed RNA polymerase subunit E'' [Candidatus Micrarchaeota archaeon]
MQCRLIVNEASECPNCHSQNLTEKFIGQLVVLDPEKSEIGKKIDAKVPGKYAIKLQQK